MKETVKVALFGANSSGKTLQIRSLIERCGPGSVGIVSCEHGLNTIASSVVDEFKREPTNINELKEAWGWAAAEFQGNDKWVCVDGGTRALTWIAGEIWAGTDAAYLQLATGMKRDQLAAGLRPFLRFITSDGEINGQAQWIAIGRAIEFELNRWSKLTCNIYWTFWEDLTSLDQYKKGLPWQADAPGKAGRDAIYATFDFILRLTRNGESIVATHDASRLAVRSKARDDWVAGIKIPREMKDFTLSAFVDLLTPKPQKEPA